MQTRKRAKSVLFGKKEKDHIAPKVAEKEEVKSTANEGAEKKAEKAEVVERRPVTEKPSVVAEPPTPTEIIKDPAAESEDVTSANELVMDNQPIQEPTEAKPEASAPEPTLPSDNLSTPVIEPEVTPQPTQLTQELSPTPPPSAFTLQNNNIDTSSDSEGKKRHFFLYFFIIAILAFVLGLGAMAAVTYGFIKIPSSMNTSEWLAFMNPPTATPTPKPSPTPEPTAKPVDTSTYTVTVLNGSGVTGKAAAVKSSLEAAGFKVSAIGVADRSDYLKTQIAAKKDIDKTYLTSLETELKKTFSIEEVSTIPSDASQKTDVVVTLGKTAAK